jgi:hypothetical protein
MADDTRDGSIGSITTGVFGGAQHVTADSADQSRIPVFLETDEIIDKLRTAIETAAIRNYDTSDEGAT